MFLLLGIGLLLTLLVPVMLAKMQRRRLLKLGGMPGELGYELSPRRNMKMVREWGREIKEKKKERKEGKKRAVGGVGVGGTGRQGKKLESVLEDVEMQWVEAGLKDGGCGAGVGKKG